jgi:hypothetical protein
MNPEKPITAYNDPGNVKEQLRRQLGFIQTSCNSYDAGAHEEAVRIAVHLRVLFHQKPPKSHSLIDQLSLRASVKILSTFPKYEPQEGVVAIYFGGRLSHHGVAPALDESQHRGSLSVDDWWQQVVHVYNCECFSRGDVVLKAANEDGGAHVAPNPSPKTKQLRTGVGRLVTMMSNGTTSILELDNTHFHLIRQFGYEVLHSPDLCW